MGERVANAAAVGGVPRERGGLRAVREPRERVVLVPPDAAERGLERGEQQLEQRRRRQREPDVGAPEQRQRVIDLRRGGPAS